MTLAIRNLKDVDPKKINACDLLITAQSFEPRGRALPNALRSRAAECWELIKANHGTSPETAVGTPMFDGVVLAAEGVRPSLSHWLEQRRGETARLVVDVSCMSRPIMAAVFESLCRAAESQRLIVVVGYVLAKYSPPPIDIPPNEDITPVSDWFAGWPTNDLTGSTALVVGLGYERNKAEGACEYFDASDSWAFVPKSPIKQYDLKVLENNQEFLDRVRRKGRAIEYRVDRPAETFGLLTSVVSSLLPKANPVLLPFGPKIIFAINLLIAGAFRDAGVWHVSGDSDLPETSHDASDHWVAFEVEMDSNDRSVDWD